MSTLPLRCVNGSAPIRESQTSASNGSWRIGFLDSVAGICAGYDYMQEKEQPLTDDDLAQDVLGLRRERQTSSLCDSPSTTGSPTSTGSSSSLVPQTSASGARVAFPRSAQPAGNSPRSVPIIAICSMRCPRRPLTDHENPSIIR